MAPPDRPLYCGNYEYEMPELEIRRIFEEYGTVDRIDMKTFCFVYMSDERDAERACRKLNGLEVGRRRRPLNVQWAKTKDADRKRDTRPSSTLFVVNFDTARTRERDLERHFEQYGRIKRVEIKKAYAFIQFERVEDAKYALEKTHLTMIDGRTVTVEYVQNEDPTSAKERGFPDERAGGDRDRDRDYGRGGGGGGRERDYDRDRDTRRRSPSRSRSPVRRGRSRSRSRSPRRDRSYSR